MTDNGLPTDADKVAERLAIIRALCGFPDNKMAFVNAFKREHDMEYNRWMQYESPTNPPERAPRAFSVDRQSQILSLRGRADLGSHDQGVTAS